MINTTDSVIQWALLGLASVATGSCLLVGVAFFRRWQQIRYARYVHELRRRYRPVLAKQLSGSRNAAEIAALRELPLADLELLLDPVFTRRKITERSLVFLQLLCAELGLIELWQTRLLNGRSASSKSSRSGTHGAVRGRAAMRYLLRAKSIQNLGMLRHRPSWPLLIHALHDRHADIQSVALRSLAAVGAPESFPALRERFHAVVQGESTSPSLRGLQAALVSFDLSCAPALGPSLCHPVRQIRLHATEILRTMVWREAARQPGFTLTSELLTRPVVELLVAELAVDRSAEIRASVAEVIVFLADARAAAVLSALLLDRRWLVRLRTARALAHLRRGAVPLHANLRECLCDSHWRVREAAIQTFIAIGQEGKRQIYEYFLASADRATRAQIVHAIERTGLMSALVEAYSEGAMGVEARMVEQLAGAAAPLGLSGLLRTLAPEVRRKFLLRFVPDAESKMPHREVLAQGVEQADNPQQVIESPPGLVA